jgi:hypothetical protein
MQRKPAKGKGKAKNETKQPTQASEAPAADAQEGTQNEAPPAATQATQAPSAVASHGTQNQPPAAIPSLAPEATQNEASEAVQASQVSMVVEPSQDLFDDISDDIIASLPDVEPEPANEKGKKKVKTEKVKKVSSLYHGKPRRSSERVKANWSKTPITGVGASQEQPIEIKEANDGDLINDDAKLGTCFRSMKSWKDLPKKKNK